MIVVFRKKRNHQHSIENIYNDIFHFLNKNTNLKTSSIELKGYLLFFIDIIRLNFLKEKVFFFTGDCNYLIPFLFGKRIILVVHDTGHFAITLKGIKKYLYGLFWFRLPLKRVEKIICVSENTKENLQRSFKINKPVFVIENPVSESFFEISNKITKPPLKILQVGTGAHKNIETLCKAITGLKLELIVIGELNQSQINALESNSINFKNYFNLPFEDLLYQYERADIISVISLGEGFGLPIIEAQAARRALIVSNVSPLKEIAGNIQTKVDPRNVEEIREMVINLIRDNEFRQEQIKQGFKNSKKYSLKRISFKYFEVIK